MQTNDSIRWYETSYSSSHTIAQLINPSTEKTNRRFQLNDVKSGGSIDHENLLKRSNAVQAKLREYGDKGTVVACLLSDEVANYICTHAVFSQGMIYISVNANIPHERILNQLKEAQVQLIVTEKKFLNLSELFRDNGFESLFIDHLTPTDNKAVCSPPKPNDVAAYIFTSGSTGEPKAVIRTQGDLAHATYVLARSFTIEDDEIFLQTKSSGTVSSLNTSLFAMACGFSIVLLQLDDLDIHLIKKTLIEERVSMLDTTPSIFRLLISTTDSHYSENHVKKIVLSGEKVYYSDLKNLRNSVFKSAMLLQNYGSTETGPIYSGSYDSDYHTNTYNLPLNRIAPNTEISIVDNELNIKGSNDIGHVVVSSNYMSPGYLNDSSNRNVKIQVKQIEDMPSFMTSDLGYINSQDELVITGRVGNQVNVSGQRVELAEIESALLDIVYVSEAFAGAFAVKNHVTGVKHNQIGVIVSGDLDKLSQKYVVEELSKTVPQSQLPTRVLITNTLPKTQSLKIDRIKCHGMIVDYNARVDRHTYIDSLENHILDCIQDITGGGRPDNQTELLTMGVDSILYLQLTILLKERFGYVLEENILFHTETISSLARKLKMVETEQKALVPLSKSDGEDIIIFFPGLGGHAWNLLPIMNNLQSAARLYGCNYQFMFAHKKQSDISSMALSILDELSITNNRSSITLIGFSSGAYLACDVASVLLDSGCNIQKLFLLDPWKTEVVPLVKRLKSQMRNYLRLLIGKNNHDTKHHMIRKYLDINTKKQRKFMANLSYSIPDVKTFVLLSSLTDTDDNKRNLLENCKNKRQLQFESFSGTHLEMMRYPHVKKTTEWLNQLI